MNKAIIQIKRIEDNNVYREAGHDINHDTVKPEFYEPFEVEYVKVGANTITLSDESSEKLGIYCIGNPRRKLVTLLLHEINLIMVVEHA